MNMKKIVFLVFLGVIGMFLSEYLIWNVMSFNEHIVSNKFLPASFLLIFGMLIYILLFIVGADLVYRLRLNDPISIILLGSIYGLILEGVYADMVYRIGLGPNIFGLSYSRLAFPALSWHAVIDFYIGIFIFSQILSGKSILTDKKIGLKEIFGCLLFTFFWISWAHSSYLKTEFPMGIPLFIQVFVLLFPMVLIGILLSITSKWKWKKPDKILGKTGYILISLFFLYGLIMRFISTPNKMRVIGFLGVILIYIILFMLNLRYVTKKRKISILDKAFEKYSGFNVKKYLKICSCIIVSYLIINLGVMYLRRFILPIFTGAFVILSTLFVMVFFFYVVYRIIRNIIASS
jgi:hypothetical protein